MIYTFSSSFPFSPLPTGLSQHHTNIPATYRTPPPLLQCIPYLPDFFITAPTDPPPTGHLYHHFFYSSPTYRIPYSSAHFRHLQVDPGPTTLYLFFTLYYTPPFSFLYCLIVYSLKVTRISIFCMYFYPSTYSLCTTPIYILFSHVPSLLHPIRHLLSLSLVSALFLTTPLFLMFLLLPPFSLFSAGRRAIDSELPIASHAIDVSLPVYLSTVKNKLCYHRKKSSYH